MRDLVAELTRPIIGQENRTPLETFDIMCDRIRSALKDAEPVASAATHLASLEARGVRTLGDLASPPPAVSDGWRSMDSAPKDGTPILVYCSGVMLENERITTVEWFPMFERYRLCVVEGYDAYPYPESPPTHWMSLPTPPKQGGE